MKHFASRFGYATLFILAVLLIAACNAGTNISRPNDVAAGATSAPPTEPAPTKSPAATQAPTIATTVTTTEATAVRTTAGQITFRIDQTQSEARFDIDEILRGSPKTVVGVTSLVSGDITVDLADPARTQVGVITIDARDLTTDANMRNGAIRRFILQSDREAYQYITFEPTAVAGLPAVVQPGDKFSFTMTGNLKIRDIAQPVTFNVDLAADSATQISGLASATITRSAYDLVIPSVPGVANVGEDVKLALQFVALAQGSKP